MRTNLMLAALLAAFVSYPANAQLRRTISFDNNCAKGVRVWISHADGYRNWHVHGPFNYSSMEGPTRLEDNGVTLTQTDDHAVYIYAESVDGRTVWEGDYPQQFQGTRFNMMKANTSIRNGQLYISLTCS
ncbi:MAG: hypothetical protein KGQ52_12890 [Alphaproteobacteria bacterium]|nr:hypothetical protein [Alphaproteobacteria bacterium]